MKASAPHPQDNRRFVHFDTDSQLLRICNCTTRSILPYVDDFITPLSPLQRRKIQGIIEQVGELMTGTIQWQIEDDDGIVHNIVLPNSIYIPGSTSRLLSPQHWAQEANDHKPMSHGTWCATFDHEIILYWNQQNNKRTIPIDPGGNNIAMIRTAPGFTRFNAFCAEIGAQDDDTIITYNANVVRNDQPDATDTLFDNDLPLQRE